MDQFLRPKDLTQAVLPSRAPATAPTPPIEENYKKILVITIITGVLFIVSAIALFYLTTIILPIILLCFGLLTPIIGIVLFATQK